MDDLRKNLLFRAFFKATNLAISLTLDELGLKCLILARPTDFCPCESWVGCFGG